MTPGASAFGDFARQRATEQSTAVSMAELEQYNRDRQNAEAENAAMFQYLQAVVQPENPGPGDASVPMMMPPPRAAGFGATQIPPPPGPSAVGGFSAGIQVPGAPPPGPFAMPGGAPPGLGLPSGMPPAPVGAPPAPPMPASWKGPSPTASPALGGPAGGGGSPAGASPVAGAAPPAGLPTPPQMAMPPGMAAPAQAAAGVPGMIPAQPQQPLPGVEKIKPIPVDQIYAKIQADTKLTPTQKYHVMTKVLAIANNQNEELRKSMESRAFVAERAAAAARAAAQEWRATHPPEPRQPAGSDASQMIDIINDPDSTPEARAEAQSHLDALNRRGKGAAGGAGGGGGGGDQPSGKGMQALEDRRKGTKYVVNSAGQAWEAGEDGKYRKINPNAVPKDAVKVGSALGGQGAREAIFTQRMVTAANEAVGDLSNVASLPIGASTGILGVGRHQGNSPLDATKEALTNKLTSQDVQLYTTFATGFQRSLATIEAVGLMPSGALTNQMESVMLKEGDTQLTKLARLAQIRQILENALEVTQANPRVTDEEKAEITKVLNKARAAVPYTPKDIIALSASQDPKATLKSIMPKGGTSKPAAKDDDTPPPKDKRVPGKTMWKGHVWQADGWHEAP